MAELLFHYSLITVFEHHSKLAKPLLVSSHRAFESMYSICLSCFTQGSVEFKLLAKLLGPLPLFVPGSNVSLQHPPPFSSLAPFICVICGKTINICVWFVERDLRGDRAQGEREKVSEGLSSWSCACVLRTMSI